MGVLHGLDLLIAVVELKMLQSRRARAVDIQDWELYRSCHADDFTSFTLADPTQGIDRVIEGMKETLRGVRSAHHVMLPEFSFETETRATGIWVLHDRLWWNQDGEEHWFEGWGHYNDGYEIRNGQWLFTSRRITRSRIEHSPGSRLTR